MQFTEKETRLIKKAEMRVKQAVIVRVLAILAAIGLIALFFLGKLVPEELAAAAVGLVLLSVLAPQMGGAPKYEQLVSILASKLEREHSHRSEKV